MLPWFLLGCGIGYSPVLYLFAAEPGFADAFVAGLKDHFRLGATNMPLAVPWPTLPLDVENFGLALALSNFLVGVGFVVLALFPVLLILLSITPRARAWLASPDLLVPAALAIGYAHYAFSRADLFHLSVSIFPILVFVGVLSLRLRSLPRWGLFAMLLLFSSLAAGIPAFYNETYLRPTIAELGRGEYVYTTEKFAQTLRRVRDLSGCDGIQKCDVMIIPGFKTLDAVIGSASPMRDIYPVWKRSDAGRTDELERVRSAMPSRVIFIQQKLSETRATGSFCSLYKEICDLLESEYPIRHYERLPLGRDVVVYLR
jgi:hypothetical protein